MKPLIDALGEIIAAYDVKRPCPLCGIRVEEKDHGPGCAWESVRAWRDDCQGIMDRILAKAKRPQ